MKIKKGELVELTSGEYSDYQRHCWARAETDIDTDELVKEYLVKHPEQRKEYHASFDKFMAWMFRNNTMIEEDAPGEEWYLGAYSNLYISGDKASMVKAGDFFK